MEAWSYFGKHAIVERDDCVILLSRVNDIVLHDQESQVDASRYLLAILQDSAGFHVSYEPVEDILDSEEVLLLVLPLLNFRNLIEAALSPHERDSKIGRIVFSDGLIIGNY